MTAAPVVHLPDMRVTTPERTAPLPDSDSFCVTIAVEIDEIDETDETAARAFVSSTLAIPGLRGAPWVEEEHEGDEQEEARFEFRADFEVAAASPDAARQIVFDRVRAVWLSPIATCVAGEWVEDGC